MAAFLMTSEEEKKLALYDFAEGLAAQSWQWSEHDCMMTVADWIERLHNVDPAKVWRGAYDSPEAAQAMAAREGGFAAGVTRALDGLPLARTDAPSIGDVGLVSAPLRWKNLVVGGTLAIRWWDECWMIPVKRGIHVNRDFGLITAWRT